MTLFFNYLEESLRIFITLPSLLRLLENAGFISKSLIILLNLSEIF